MTASNECARCGGTKLVPARLEQNMAFHVDDDTHHSLRRVGMKAILCQDCGYAEFWVMDPAHALACDEPERVAAIQEEDF